MCIDQQDLKLQCSKLCGIEMIESCKVSKKKKVRSKKLFQTGNYSNQQEMTLKIYTENLEVIKLLIRLQ
jgi:hypothetical protein